MADVVAFFTLLSMVSIPLTIFAVYILFKHSKYLDKAILKLDIELEEWRLEQQEEREQYELEMGIEPKEKKKLRDLFIKK